MAGDVTLTAAMRNGLLTAQKTGSLLERTANRLANGLKVTSVKDDAVAYFQARGLNERAADFANIKDNISSGISTIKAALDGLGTVETLLFQMKGVALGAKSEPSPGNRQALYRQYTALRGQIDQVAADSHYNGCNLIGNPVQDLTVQLSPADHTPRSSLTVSGMIITYTNLQLDDGTHGVDIASYAANPVHKKAVDDWVVSIGRETRYGGSGAVQSYATFGTIGADFGLDPFGAALGSPGYYGMVEDAGSSTISFDAVEIGSNPSHVSGAVQYQAALVMQDYLANGGTLGATVTDPGSGLAVNDFTSANYPGLTINVPSYPWDCVTGYEDNLDVVISQADRALELVRATISSLGSNTAMLQIRTDYTEKLINEGKQGASKLVNADINEEGANMAALQTRQQLINQSLKLTTESEQGILSLFR